MSQVTLPHESVIKDAFLDCLSNESELDILLEYAQISITPVQIECQLRKVFGDRALWITQKLISLTSS